MAILAVLFFIISFSLVIFGLLYKPKLKSIYIAPNEGKFNKQCFSEKVSCNTDSDCLSSCVEAQSGEEYVCKTLPDIPGLTPTQQKILSAHGDASVKASKYCVPENASLDCNISTGGIPVFSGWSGAERMEFDCLCAYPMWASSRVCDQNGNCRGNCILNPGICNGGVFDWDLTKKTQEPVAGMCNCAEDHVLTITPSGLPRCVPKNMQNFYDDMDVSLGIRGEQPLIKVDSIPAVQEIANVGCTSLQYTQCSGGCCMLPTAICCEGANYCCPTEYPICDVANLRCLKKTSTCSDAETKCSGGCAPIANGICCSDGVSACPPPFPKCDLQRGVCNPQITNLTTSQCDSKNNTQCDGGCCPLLGGSCCGNGKNCCPPEYPVCDVANQMCKKFP
jgi:hypothetical protein